MEAPLASAVFGPRIAMRRPLEWKTFHVGLIGGALSVLANGLVLYVKTIAPIASVSPIRESIAIIAALIGVMFLGDRPSPSGVGHHRGEGSHRACRSD